MGRGEFLCEGGDGALELQNTCVSLGQRIPQALKLLRQTSEFTLRLFKLGLKDRNTVNDTYGKRDRDVDEKSKGDTGLMMICNMF